MKTEFENARVLIKQDKRGYQPVIFLFENNRVYIVGITPDHCFDITDEGEIGVMFKEVKYEDRYL